MGYPFRALEKKWQAYWRDKRVFCVSEDERFPPERRAYVLDMFPYPSAQGLHVGHPEGYTATDIYCRYLRMGGYNVLHPMGFDAFGLPAENFALKTGTHPRVSTSANCDTFRRQIQSFGFSYDWEREISTADPEYYRWTQWLFLKLYEKGLAYEATAPINWCPSCKTGLANEEVRDACCERCGAEVTRRGVRQWMVRITAYAERLLSDLDELDWPESVKQMQRNWIGKSCGAEIDFPVDAPACSVHDKLPQTIRVYTTRADTLFGVTYLVLAPEHEAVTALTTHAQRAAVQAYVQRAAKKNDLERTDLAKEKTGVFTGAYVRNPINDMRIPVWVGDYVLVSYGTGAVMAVPAHDQRDWDFATRFGLPKLTVVSADYTATVPNSNSPQGAVLQRCVSDEGFVVNSGAFNGLASADARERIVAHLEMRGAGARRVTYRLRDWVFSRQRYWGEPIPLVHCPSCGVVPLPESALPLLLPETADFTPTEDGQGPLARARTWLRVPCPQCASDAVRETNTMPQWAGSCWYYLRYMDPRNKTAFCAPEKERYWAPVALYVGGAEHAVLHLLYARFWHKVLYDLGLVSTKEPFARLVNQGMITSYAYRRKNGALVPHDEVHTNAQGTYVHARTGEKLECVVAKMSKALKNVVNPDDMIAAYGADACRAYEMFMGPLEASKPWNTQGLVGVFRFLEKIWVLAGRVAAANGIPQDSRAEPPGDLHAQKKSCSMYALETLLHRTIQKVTDDTSALSFNTAISQMMIFVNEATRVARRMPLPSKMWEMFVKILSPYAPHLAEELWEMCGHTHTIAYEPWPQVDPARVAPHVCSVVVQVNGKVRDTFSVAPNAPNEELEQKARETAGARKFLGTQQPKRVVIVPNKLVNFVL